MIKYFQKLGSSAGIPTKNRGVTSLMICSKRYDIMIDCGEGTYIKWLSEGYKWRRLKYIFITHMHPDHTAGLIPLIFYRNILRIESDLTIYGPPILEKYIEQSLSLQGINLKFNINFNSVKNNMAFDLNDRLSVNTIKLEHKILCFGYRINDGVNSIVFITDSLPIKETIQFSLKANHFIHEATFTDDNKLLASETKHTTINQAIVLGNKANVKQIYLTHFSPRIKDDEIKILENKYNFISLNKCERISL